MEFALVLPLLVLMLLGMMDYGWYFFVEINTSAAAREGARTATTFPGSCPNPAASSAAASAVTSRIADIGYAATTTVTTTCSTLADGDPQFEVQVQVLFPQLTGFTLLPMPRQGNDVRAFARSTMRGVH